MFNIAKQKNRPMILIGGWQRTLEKKEVKETAEETLKYVSYNK